MRQNEERIRYLQEKLGKKEIEESEWIRQKEELADIKQQIKELDSSILLLTHQIETMTKDLAKKEELEQKWETESHKKDMIKELEQLFKGNAFIEYVAQSKLSYIAREASVILSKISGGSYALEINDSAELSSGIIKWRSCPPFRYLVRRRTIYYLPLPGTGALLFHPA